MARIKRPVLSVYRENGGAAFTFEVKYTAVFTYNDLNETFLDCIDLFEHDVTNGDDLLTPDPCAVPEEFVVSQREVPRTKKLTLSDRQVSTEFGDEEVYAIVHLSGSTTGEQDNDRTNEVEVRT
jgi:hypothetical protein